MIKICFSFSLFLLLITSCLLSCQNSPEQLKLRQYVNQGQQLYTQHCSNCHQTDGSGLAALYPPLAQSDFLKDNLINSICLVRNGLSGAIEVNGNQYDLPMPANEKLTLLEIAEITTYITNSWGNNHGLVSVKQVEQALEDCSELR